MTTPKGGQPGLVWSPAMIEALVALRQDAVPLYRCAEKIGVGYGTAVKKAHELNLAGRMNKGPIPGAVARRTQEATATTRTGQDKRGRRRSAMLARLAK